MDDRRRPAARRPLPMRSLSALAVIVVLTTMALGLGYRGLYLLQRNGDRYFLLAVDGSPDTGRLLVLKDGDPVRVELGR